MYLTFVDGDLQSPGSGSTVSSEVMKTADAVSLVAQHVSNILFPAWSHVTRGEVRHALQRHVTHWQHKIQSFNKIFKKAELVMQLFSEANSSKLLDYHDVVSNE